MHLVSVLRDLITCRLEHTEGVDDTTKLVDLHSNIINLLTNMPSTCYEELLSPLNPMSLPLNNNQQQQEQPPSSYYLNVRMAHNRKRISRRSKRIKQKQQQEEQLKNVQSQPSDTADDQFLNIGSKFQPQHSSIWDSNVLCA